MSDVTPDTVVETTPDATPAAGGSDDWRTGLPEDLRADPTLAKFKDVGNLAKSYVHVQKMINEKGLIPPKSDSPPEMWDQFYTALGRPESPDKYEFGEVNLPEGYELDADLDAAFKAEAHKAGLTSQQAAALREWYFGSVAQQIQAGAQAQKTSLEEAERDLREEWGPEYDHKVEAAKRVWRSFVDPAEMPAAIELFDKSGLGNNPLLVRMFARVAEAMGEDRLVQGDPANSMNYAEQAHDILMSEAYCDAKHPGHKAAVIKAEKLFKLAYPEQEGQS